MLYDKNGNPLVEVDVKTLEFNDTLTEAVIKEMIVHKEDYTQEELEISLSEFLNDAITNYINKSPS